MSRRPAAANSLLLMALINAYTTHHLILMALHQRSRLAKYQRSPGRTRAQQEASPVVGSVHAGIASVDFDVRSGPEEGSGLQTLVLHCVPNLERQNRKQMHLARCYRPLLQRN